MAVAHGAQPKGLVLIGVRSCRSEVVVARRVHDLVVEMKDGTWFSIEIKMLRQKPRKP
jgi:hypothetical protein